MNKKKLLLTIVIDLAAVAALVVAVYSLMSKDLNGWQSNLATAVAVLALPVIFYSIFIQLAFSKYGKMQKQDDKRWEKEE